MDGESFNRTPAHAATSAKVSVPPPNASTSRLIAQPACDWICRFQLTRNWPVIFNPHACAHRSIGSIFSDGRVRRFVPASEGRDHVTLAHNNLVHRPRLVAVARDELSLLDPAIDVYVVALLERLRDMGKLSVKTDAVPVRKFPCFTAAFRVLDGLAHPDIGHRGVGKEMPYICLLRDISCNHSPVHLHSWLPPERQLFAVGMQSLPFLNLRDHALSLRIGDLDRAEDS